MTLFNILIVIFTIIQIVTCGFSFWIFLAMIGRSMFLLRAIGIILKAKTSVIFEGVCVACLFLWESLFSKDHLPWKTIIIYFVVGLAIAFIEYLDDLLFVYTTEDDVEITEVVADVQLSKRNKNRKRTGHRHTKSKTSKRRRRT